VVILGRALVVVIVALVGVAACGSDGDVGSPGTHLRVEGVATSGLGLVPPGSEPGAGDITSSTSSPDAVIEVPTVPSTGNPDDAVEIPFSGSVDCDGATSTGDGIFAASAAAVCAAITNQAGTLEAIGNATDQACAQIYGGPQHVTIKGSVDGVAVDVDIDRSDGCGIDAWQRVEWLIGPPER
jgi:hypothetical protein